MNWRMAVGCLLLLCASMSRAEQYFTHSFVAGTGMSFTDGNKTASMNSDSIVYHCSTKAEFGAIDPGHGDTRITAKLLNTNDSLTTRPAIHKLSSVQVNYHPTATRDNLKVYVSTNASDWTEATYMTYTSTYVKAVFPSGDYFVKIVNTNGSKDVYVWSIEYGIRDCNCQLYVAP